MPFYTRLGDVPRKRHIQHRENGTLLTEEVMGLEGFSGNESILYHVTSPCRVKELGTFEPIVREEWVPDAHAHRHFTTWDIPEGGDAITGRKLLMWNADVEISLCRPTDEMQGFYRNGEGDEVIFVHEGSGTLETIFGDVPYKPGDYVVVPRGTTYRFAGVGPQRHLVFESPGLIEIPRRYRNHYGQLLEHAPYYTRDIHPPAELHTHRDRDDHVVTVRVKDGYQRYVLDYHPFDVVGWDGYVYPWTFSIHDFEPITGRIHMPPPSHQTFEGRNFVICSFCPRKLDFDPLAIPIPYHHSNLNSEEMIYYVDGNFSSRKGIEVGSVTLHPSGIPHGPQPGLAERSIGMTETHELAVMCDTFHPLRLTTLAKTLDDGKYWHSWYEPGDDGNTPDNDPAGITSHLDLAAAGVVPALTLEHFFADGRREWDGAVERIVAAVAAGAEPRYPLDGITLHLPFAVADFVDFYASLEHATNMGRLFRPGGDPLLRSWRSLPVGYHGRAGTVVLSGTEIRRPHGQYLDGDTPAFGPTRKLDVEVELGFVVGRGSRLGEPVSLADFREHVFGVVLVNDWSARDIQGWEYQPLGPFLGKSFATSISAWVTPLALLEDRRVEAPPQDPEPLPYLRGARDWALDVELSLELNADVLSRVNARTLYWTGPQLLTHLTSNGSSLRPGDLLATGTISAPEPGSLIELGRLPLLDGDEVVIRGRAGDVELGEVRGRVAPA